MRRRTLLRGLGGAGVLAATAGVSGYGAGGAEAAGRGVPGAAGAGGGPAAGDAAGAGWRLVPGPVTEPGARLLSVTASSEGRAWAVGEQGLGADDVGRPLALQWDGAEWRQSELGDAGVEGPLRSVSSRPVASNSGAAPVGSSSSGASAVSGSFGGGGPDGPSGGRASTGAGAHAGAGAEVVWAVAGAGAAGVARLLRWDGAGWQRVPYPGEETPGTELTWAETADDGSVWVAGRFEDGTRLLHHDGEAGRWTPPVPGESTAEAPGRVRLSPSGEAHLVGRDLARWDGQGWTVLPAVPGIRLVVTDLLPFAPDEVWAVGGAFGVGGPPGKPPGMVLARFDGSAWSHVSGDGLPFSVGALQTVCAVGTGRGPGTGAALAAGWDFWDDSTAPYLRWDGAAWSGERGEANGEDVTVRDVCGVPGTGGAWSVGHTRNTGPEQTRFRIERYG